MIRARRTEFNRGFTAEKYHEYLAQLDEAVGMKIEFRVAETPVFIPASLLTTLVTSANEIIAQLHTPEYRKESARAVPDLFRVPHDDDHPLFVVVDFAILRGADGGLVPRLIELQGFPSLYGFQPTQARVCQQAYALPGDLAYIVPPLTWPRYVELFREAVCGGHAPENVILMDVHPEQQKTRPDFTCTEKLIGVPAVCVTEVIQRGRKLFYRRGGRELPVHRIFNRVILDEFVKKGVLGGFDLRDDLDVEWAGHPNWYFRWSKYSLPSLRHPAVPRAMFLDRATVPDDLENFVLKPLFSFAGSGVQVDVGRDDIDAIPESQRSSWLLQEKVAYGGVIETLDEPAKVEVRVMYFWTDRPVPAVLLARLSKGKMMGVDFNRNKEWVGSSCCLFDAAGRESTS